MLSTLMEFSNTTTKLAYISHKILQIRQKERHVSEILEQRLSLFADHILPTRRPKNCMEGFSNGGGAD